MAEGTRVVELRKDAEGLKEQVRLTTAPSEKSIGELRGMIATIAAVMTTNPHNNHSQGRGKLVVNRG
ncbi:UNVERIFIED_CONTAM: hypothetical protein Sradi_2486300 [Sesamum radiatum]|uniref:Uncharacterized protein n=1 Tax=Sesamum radiatum TaxID=300843 RepID=A0AAW2SJF8_SESRA